MSDYQKNDKTTSKKVTLFKTLPRFGSFNTTTSLTLILFDLRQIT